MMKNLLKKLRSRKVEDRIDAVNKILASEKKPEVETLLECLSEHPGFAKKKGGTPKDCQWYTKKALRMEWEPSFYRQIASDPYRDDYVLPDVYLDEQESNLLSGAKEVAGSTFYDDGGRETLDVLKRLFDIDEFNVEYKWIKFKDKGRGTYGGYLYTKTVKVFVGENRMRVLAVLTNGRIFEIPAEEIEGCDEFVWID